MKRAFFLIVLFVGMQSTLFAQRKADYQDQYLQAKNLFKQERWTEAMQAFGALTAADKQNVFAEYASFYYGLSAMKSGSTPEARAMFKQIQQRYPGWDKQPEVSFWLAKTYFKEQAYRQAIAEVQNIRSRQVRQDAEKMAVAELSNITDLKVLELLLKDFNERFVAEALANRIYQQPLALQNRVQLEELVSTYRLDRKLLEKPEIAASEKKSAYEVGVLLPFLLKDAKPEAGMHERYFILDLYEGMKLAQQDLQKEGVTVKLHAFDTKRDSAATNQILAQPALATMDLLVGPLFPMPSKVANRFAQKHQINIVNPLSVNPEYIRKNPYSFLFKPSLETQGIKAAEFAKRTFQENKHATVVYSYRERDSIMANSYRQILLADNFTVRMVRVDEGLENAVKNALAPNAEWEETLEDPKFHADSLGHVFVATDNKLIVANVISALLSRGDIIPLIGHLDWLRNSDMARFISYPQMERMGTYFLAPDYIDYSSAAFETFRQEYKRKVNYLPTEYAYIGYELMMYFGRMMHQYGNHFQAVADREAFTKGQLCTGFSYLKNNDNQCVPIIQFRDSALEVVYQ